jgi:superfamily II DNA or RNA helicase
MADIRIRKLNEVYVHIDAEKCVIVEMAAHFTFDVEGAKFTPAYKHGLWNGTIRLLNAGTRNIYAGLFYHILEFAAQAGYTVEYDEDVHPVVDNDRAIIEKYIADVLRLHSAGNPITVYDYQVDAIKHILDNRRATIESPTSSGKSLIIFSTIRYLIAIGEVKRVLLIFPTVGLVAQMKSDFIDYSSVSGWDVEGRSHMIYSGQEKQTDKQLTFTTYQSMAKMPISYYEQFDMIVQDECFSPDTEILTNRGFVRFDELSEVADVAQYDCGNISFVKPLRYITKHYDGELVHISSDSRIDLLVTPNHDMLIRRTQKHGYVDKKVTAAEVNFNALCNLYGAGLAVGDSGPLTPKQKLMIALQADGCIVGRDGGKQVLQFKFSKERKITEFLALMAEGGFSYNELKSIPAYGKTKEKRRFSIYNIDYATKDVSTFFDVSTLSSETAKEIIEYMVIWDGSISSENRYYYSNTSECSVDFYQTVAVLAGYIARKTIQIDSRSDKFSDVHRLYIRKTNIIGTQGMQKERVQYSGNVHCVTVPSGNIIVRRKGFVVVVGNCHTAKSKSITDIMERAHNVAYRVGFTGSLQDSKCNRLVIEGLFGKAFKTITTRELIDNGQAANLKISCILIKHREEVAKAMARSKATYAQEMDYLCTSERRNAFIAGLANSLKGNTLILFTFVGKQGLPIYNLLKDAGNCHFIHGKVDVESRDAVRQIAETTDDCTIVASYGTFSTGVSIKRIDNIIFASPYKSKIKVLQSVGRGLRKGNGKYVCNLFDLADDMSYKSYKNHTLDHFEKRVGYYAKDQFDYKVISYNLK